MLSALRLALTHPSASDHIYIGIYLQTANKAADRYRKNQNCAPLILVLSLLTMFLQQYILYTICVPMKHLRVYMYICIIEITYRESKKSPHFRWGSSAHPRYIFIYIYICIYIYTQSLVQPAEGTWWSILQPSSLC